VASQAHRARRGQGIVEYLLIVVLVSLTVVFAINRYGATMRTKVDCATGVLAALVSGGKSSATPGCAEQVAAARAAPSPIPAGAPIGAAAGGPAIPPPPAALPPPQVGLKTDPGRETAPTGPLPALPPQRPAPPPAVEPAVAPAAAIEPRRFNISASPGDPDYPVEVRDQATGALVEVIKSSDVSSRYEFDSTTNTFLLKEDAVPSIADAPPPAPEPTAAPQTTLIGVIDWRAPAGCEMQVYDPGGQFVRHVTTPHVVTIMPDGTPPATATDPHGTWLEYQVDAEGSGSWVLRGPTFRSSILVESHYDATTGSLVGSTACWGGDS